MGGEGNKKSPGYVNIKEILPSQNGMVCPDGSYPVASTDIIEPLKKSANLYTVPYSPKEDRLPLVLGIRLTDTKITALSGALAGFVSGIAICPLDVAKTRLQAQGLQSTAENKYYSGLTGTLSTIVRDEGTRGLYKGLVPVLMGYLPTWMIYFTVYEFCKEAYPRVFPESNFVSHSCSAITAGAVSTVLTNPIWVIKTRLMLQTDISKNSTHYTGTFDAFRKIYSQEGLRALYAGLVPSFIGLFHVAIHFPVFEKLKVAFNCTTKVPQLSTSASVVSITPSASPILNKVEFSKNAGKQDYVIDIKRLIMASCVSKMIASIITYPHEILRTRMQLKSDLPKSVQHRIIPLIRTTYLKEGIRGFYSGFTVNLIRTVPASAITLVSFEYVRNFLTNLEDTSIDTSIDT